MLFVELYCVINAHSQVLPPGSDLGLVYTVDIKILHTSVKMAGFCKVEDESCRIFFTFNVQIVHTKRAVSGVDSR